MDLSLAYVYAVFWLVVIAVIIYLYKKVHFGTIEEMEKFWGCKFDGDAFREPSFRDVRKPDRALDGVLEGRSLPKLVDDRTGKGGASSTANARRPD